MDRFSLLRGRAVHQWTWRSSKAWNSSSISMPTFHVGPKLLQRTTTGPAQHQSLVASLSEPFATVAEMLALVNYPYLTVKNFKLVLSFA
jgi:hypothetical protein